MKHFYYVFVFIFFLYSCQEGAEDIQKTQDSLFIVLHIQYNILKQLPKYKPNNFQLTDSLSSRDSVLYNYLLSNYHIAIQTIDTIQFTLNKLFNEIDTLNKYIALQDTAIINRLKYLTLLQQNYIREYYKAASIAEQNNILLQLISKP